MVQEQFNTQMEKINLYTRLSPLQKLSYLIKKFNWPIMILWDKDKEDLCMSQSGSPSYTLMYSTAATT